MTIPDYIKTILNSLKQYFATKKEVRQVVSDLSKKQDELISGGASVGQFPKVKSVDSNGKPTEWDTAVAPGVGGYGYSESGNQVLLDNSVYVGEQRGWEYIEYGIPIILGNTYDVTFDGVKYSNLIAHENFDDMGRIVYIGDQELSNPPFHIDYSEQLDAILVYPEYSKIPSEVSVKIECVGEVTHQIDKKYIPTGAGLPEVDVGDDGAFLVANGDEWIKSKGGVGWSNYDQGEEIIHKINPKYISDDGYGYTYKEILAEDVSFRGELQLQDFNLVYGEKYDVTFDGVLYSNLEPYNDDGYITIGAPYGNYSDCPFNISHADNSPPYVSASGNITHVVTVSRSEEIIRKIDEKYLPETEQAQEVAIDTEPVENSTNLITSGAVFDAMQGGGGGASQRLVFEMVTTEPVTEILINKDINGLPFSLKDAYIFCCFPANPDNAENATNVWVFPDSKLGNNGRITGSLANKTVDRSAMFNIHSHETHGKTVIGCIGGVAVFAPNGFEGQIDDGFCYFNIISKTAGNSFAAGTRIVIWGVDQ